MPAAQAELFEAVKAGRLEEVESLLEKNPALLAARVTGGPSAILLAVYYRHPEVAEAFVRRGAALDIFDASALGRTDRMRELLREDPKLVDAWSDDGFFPLGLAAFFGRPDAVRLLLDSGADVRAVARNPMRVEALHSAAAGHDASIVLALLEAGADPNARQQVGFTALHEAASEGLDEMARLLVAHGARVDLSTEDGKTAVDLARGKGHGKLADWLEARRGARIEGEA
ncbi:MAG: ankyrin repeat domain-containing protein [Acidobacteriota bacterium]|nr:ankyrin repeat domain-containing protein [Acidobacteriota bacterium]